MLARSWRPQRFYYTRILLWQSVLHVSVSLPDRTSWQEVITEAFVHNQTELRSFSLNAACYN